MLGPSLITGPQTDRARIALAPCWVLHDPYDAPLQPEDMFVAGGCCTLLDDTQVNLTGPLPAFHHRRAERVLTHAGAERAAQFSVAFDPSCETLDVHFVRVRRGCEAFDYARPDAFEILRRERSLERLLFDGRLTVHLVVPDVRPGDILESAYTLTGGSPILRDRHAMWVAFEWSQALIETRHRILALESRPLRMRAVNGAPDPVILRHDGCLEYRWRAHRRAPVEPEPVAPSWQFRRAGVQVSEFVSWEEVAQRETALYRHSGPLPEDLEAVAASMMQTLSAPQERAAEALRVVQGHIRYLAMAIGESGRLAPRPLEAIWQSRYGDCKDKARILCALLRRLEIDACPALVNTLYGDALDEWLPTAAAFDHVIARVSIDHHIHWLDPSRTRQSGRFERIARPYFGWALPLCEGQSTLQHMGPVSTELVVSVRERIALGDRPDTPATYNWTVSCGCWRADDLRERIANEGIASVQKSYLRQLQALWPGLTPITPMHCEDFSEDNRIETTESYCLPTPWSRVSDEEMTFSSADFYLAPDVPDVPPGPRSQDIALGRPRIAERTVVVELPEAWPLELWDVAVSAPGISFSSTLFQPEPRRAVLKQRLEISAFQAPAESVDEVRAVIAAMRSASEIRLQRRVAGGRFHNGPRPGGGMWAVAFLLCALLAAMVVSLMSGSNLGSG